ncbi:unnamed protein product [Brachionus calyciflorus]|uniref:Uncharacterized protein n=1 Tax=Brachionus calyciflorus TaxID=104777 RepID=A0A813MZQ9_9BILA|nr:unnamed protein product [Brachionus calyciflorus]
MLTSVPQKTIASLTNDDTKVLGNIAPKLKRVKEQYDLETNKYKTLNSSWTPLKDKNSNKIIFEERVELVSNWFDLWSDKQRKWFLLNTLSRCTPTQLCFLEDTLSSFGVFERKDFTSVLPKYLSVYIFSFLSPKDLARCAQVSSHWKFLSEQEEIWLPKCLNFGWYLPYKPTEREFGCWKAHYIESVKKIKAYPMNKDEAYELRKSLYYRELTDDEKNKYLYQTTKRILGKSENHDILTSRKPWSPSSKRPKDLKKTDKYLYSLTANPNEPKLDNTINSLYTNAFGFPKESLKTSLKTLKQSNSINENMLVDFRKSLPTHFAETKTNFKTMRKSESDLFTTSLTESSFNAYLTFKQTQSLPNNLVNSKRSNTYRLILISSRIPCSNLLLDGIRQNVIPVQYDLDSTNLQNLMFQIEKALNGKHVDSIGFFTHFDKPGQIALTKDDIIYKFNTQSDEISCFLIKLRDFLINLENCSFDFFVPLGSSNDGLELLDKIFELTGILLRAPCGFVYNYKYLKSKWLNSANLDSSPLDEYFVENKINLWIKYCEILTDAHDRVGELVMNGYINDTDKLTLNRVAGKVLYDGLTKNELLCSSKMQNELKNFISNAVESSQTTHEFYKSLSDEINKKLEKDESEKGDKFEKSSDENLLNRSDQALKNFIKYKSDAESVEQSMRTQIVLEIVKTEINYFKCLEIIQKYYAKPLKASLDTGNKVIISQSVLDMLFADVTNLYNISKEMVKDFNLRIKNWSLSSCIADVMYTLTKSSQIIINYANNNDSIITTLDKLISSNPQFREFILPIDNTSLTNMMTIQDLLGAPWARIKEYINLLGSLQLHTPKEHQDQENISNILNKLREVYLYVKQLQERVEKKYRMQQIQKRVLNAPDLLKPGRYLILEQKAILLNRLTLKFVKEITCFLFNDGLLIAYRINQHFPFIKHSEEALIFYDLIDELYNVEIIDLVDIKRDLFVLLVKHKKYNEYYLSFSNIEEKINFLNNLKLSRSLAIK